MKRKLNLFRVIVALFAAAVIALIAVPVVAITIAHPLILVFLLIVAGLPMMAGPLRADVLMVNNALENFGQSFAQRRQQEAEASYRQQLSGFKPGCPK